MTGINVLCGVLIAIVLMVWLWPEIAAKWMHRFQSELLELQVEVMK